MSKSDTERLLGDNGYGAVRGGKKFTPTSHESIQGAATPVLIMRVSNQEMRIQALEVMVERLQKQLEMIVDGGVDALVEHAADVKAKIPKEKN